MQQSWLMPSPRPLANAFTMNVSFLDLRREGASRVWELPLSSREEPRKQRAGLHVFITWRYVHSACIECWLYAHSVHALSTDCTHTVCMHWALTVHTQSACIEHWLYAHSAWNLTFIIISVIDSPEPVGAVRIFMNRSLCGHTLSSLLGKFWERNYWIKWEVNA